MSEPAIYIKDLCKVYSDLTAVDHLSLEVARGEFFGLLGPNGAGKTTTINILCGLCNKTSGDVRLVGHDVVTDYRNARRSVGLVPQEFNFDQFVKVKKMLMFQGGYFGIPLEEREKQVDQLLKEFDLWEKRDNQMRQLSGGMKRRAMIARAMVHAPEVLILDEPTAGVDVDLRKTMWQTLRRKNAEGTTIVLTTHYIEEAEALCDSIGIIRDGKLIARDSTRNLTAQLSYEVILVTAVDEIPDEMIPRLNNCDAQRTSDAHILKLRFDNSKTNYHDVARAVLDSGLRIAQIEPEENRLESIFLELTGGTHGRT